MFFNAGRHAGLYQAAALSSLSAPRATILRPSSSNGRCSAFASSHGARIQTSYSSAVVADNKTINSTPTYSDLSLIIPLPSPAAEKRDIPKSPPTAIIIPSTCSRRSPKCRVWFVPNRAPDIEMAKKRAKPAKKKKTTPATTRSTAGTGFRFEDQVAAWLLLQALTGQELPGVKGNVTRLQMQVNALGWEHDDVLFTTDAGPGDARHLAISCKSNEQVSAAGLPADFVERAWKQWDARHPMRRDADCLMLATRE